MYTSLFFSAHTRHEFDESPSGSPTAKRAAPFRIGNFPIRVNRWGDSIGVRGITFNFRFAPQTRAIALITRRHIVSPPAIFSDYDSLLRILQREAIFALAPWDQR